MRLERPFEERDMSDEQAKRGKWDRDRINMHEEYAVRDRCEKLGCTRDERVQAIMTVGHVAVKVERYLQTGR